MENLGIPRQRSESSALPSAILSSSFRASETSLITQAKTDPQAFSKLYNENLNAIYSYIFFRVQNKQTAEDLTSETWMAALKNIKWLRTDKMEGFRAWIFKIAKNTLNKYFKTNRQTIAIDDEEKPIIIKDESLSPIEQAIQNNEKNQLAKLIGGLPDKQKEIVIMRFSGGLKNKEIAGALGTSEKTVASNLCRAIDTLKARLEKLQ